MKADAFCDGSGNSPRGSTCACVVFDRDTGEVLAEETKWLGMCSNNVAEYEGVILAIETSHDLGVQDLHVFSDSQLIVNQTNGEWKIKNKDLIPLREKAWEVGSKIEDNLKLTWIPREQNQRSDELCRILLNERSPRTLPPGKKRRKISSR